MHPIGGMLFVAIAIVTFAPVGVADCGTLETQIAPYQRQLKAAMRDEAEDLPMELRRFEKAIASGDLARAERIEDKVRTDSAALQTLEPPSDLTNFMQT